MPPANISCNISEDTLKQKCVQIKEKFTITNNKNLKLCP